jgi:predicted Zn-dependent peptidase
VAERFSGPSSGAALPSVPPWPLTGKPGAEVVHELGTEQARVYFGRIAELAPAERPALRLLGGLLSDRLMRTIREEQGLSYRLGASVNVAVDRGWLTVTVGTRPENVAAVVAGVGEQMDRLRREMAGPEEIDRLRAVQGSRALMRSMTAVNRARGLALEVFTGLPSGDDPASIEELAAVDRAEAARVAERWLDPERFQVVVVR